MWGVAGAAVGEGVVGVAVADVVAEHPVPIEDSTLQLLPRLELPQPRAGHVRCGVAEGRRQRVRRRCPGAPSHVRGAPRGAVSRILVRFSPLCTPCRGRQRRRGRGPYRIAMLTWLGPSLLESSAGVSPHGSTPRSGALTMSSIFSRRRRHAKHARNLRRTGTARTHGVPPYGPRRPPRACRGTPVRSTLPTWPPWPPRQGRSLRSAPRPCHAAWACTSTCNARERPLRALDLRGRATWRRPGSSG